MEYFLFPKKSYYLTQGFGKGCLSHSNVIALDVSAAGGGYKEIYAPFTGYVAKVYTSPVYAYSIWLVSNEKVICADDKTRYAVAMLTHPNGISKYKVGQKFKQGDLLFNDGTTGGVAAHLHLDVAVYDKKEDIVANWHQVKGDWCLVNEVNPCDYMVLPNDCKVINETFLGKKYHFKKQSEVKVVEQTNTSKYIKGNYQTLAQVYVRTGAGTNYSVKLVSQLTIDGRKNATSFKGNDQALYKTGTIFTANEIIKVSDTEYWAKTPSGYVNLEKDGIVACKKI